MVITVIPLARPQEPSPAIRPAAITTRAATSVVASVSRWLTAASATTTIGNRGG
ncbi:MAG: hypothetical protein WDO18_10755 [Acidobacteriota bacterium]